METSLTNRMLPSGVDHDLIAWRWYDYCHRSGNMPHITLPSGPERSPSYFSYRVQFREQSL